MENIIMIIVLSIVLLALGIFMLKKNNGHILISVDNIFILFYVVFFGIIFPVDYVYSLNYSKSNSYLEQISKYTAAELLLYYLCIVIFLVVFVFAFRTIYRNKNKSLPHNIYKTKQKKLFVISVALLIVGVVADLLYLSAYGGYFNYLSYSGLIRSGVSPIFNRWSFLIAFRGCVCLSSFLLFNLIRTPKIQISRLLLFVFSFVYSLFILFADKGRLSFVLYFIMFVLLFVFSKYKKNYVSFKMFALSVVGVLLFPVFVVFAGQLLSRSTNNDPFYTIVSETSFVFANFKAIISNGDLYQYRYFSDLVSFPLFILPSSIWRNMVPHTASDICTLLIMGAFKGTEGVYGESPCDIISLGFLQLNLIGVFLTAFVLGFGLGFIFKKINQSKNSQLVFVFSYYLVLYLVLQSVLYCDPYNIVQRLFPAIVFIVLYKFLGVFIKESYQKERFGYENITSYS